MGSDRRGWLGGAAYAGALFLASWVRHRNGWSAGLDLGIFDQGLWLLSEGSSPQVTINDLNLFADHLSPVLLAFVPLYVLHATPLWLLAGQALSLGAGLVGLRRFALDRGLPVWPVTAAAALSAPLLSAALFDFHPLTLAVGPLCWLLATLDRPTATPMLLAALGVLACRADLGWTVAALALVAPRERRRPLVVVGVLGGVLGAVVPGLFDETASFSVLYGQLGTSPGDALLHPWRVFTAFTARDLLTATLWFLGGGLLCLRSPRWTAVVLLAGLPVLLSVWEGTEDPLYHYGAPVAPVVLAGSLAAAERDWSRRTSQTLVAGAVLTSLLASPLAPNAVGSRSYVAVAEPRVGRALAAALERVGADEPVAASNRVLPHLSQRRAVYGFPLPFVETEYGDLYGGRDPEAASAILVVVVERSDRVLAESLGFVLEDVGGLLVGRRTAEDAAADP